VYPPNIMPLSDLAIMRVFPWPAHCSLNMALWKLCWLARNSSLACVMRLFCWEKIEPSFLISPLENTGDNYLNMFPRFKTSPSLAFQYSIYSLMISLWSYRKVLPLGHKSLKLKMGVVEVAIRSI
jgi:hypothetical protein